MTEQRPTLARKHTRASEDKRKSSLDAGIRLNCEGVTYEVRIGDLNAIHERRLRREYGISFAELMAEFGGSPGMDSIAAIVWLSRLIDGEDVTFEEVAVGVGMEFAESMIVGEPDAADPSGE